MKKRNLFVIRVLVIIIAACKINRWSHVVSSLRRFRCFDCASIPRAELVYSWCASSELVHARSGQASRLSLFTLVPAVDSTRPHFISVLVFALIPGRAVSSVSCARHCSYHVAFFFFLVHHMSGLLLHSSSISGVRYPAFVSLKLCIATSACRASNSSSLFVNGVCVVAFGLSAL